MDTSKRPPIINHLDPESPHRVLLYGMDGELLSEMQSESFWKARREAVDHIHSLAPAPTGYRILVTNTEPDHFKLELQEDTSEGRIVALLAKVEPPWMTLTKPTA